MIGSWPSLQLQDITIPFQMSTVEFFALVRDHLAPGGVMVVNLNMHSDGEGSINQALCDTIASLFPYVSTVDVPGTTNRELFAAVDGDPVQWLAQRRVAALCRPTKQPAAVLTSSSIL